MSTETAAPPQETTQAPTEAPKPQEPAEKGVLTVTKNHLMELFGALGYAGATGWSASRLIKKAQDLPENLEKDKELREFADKLEGNLKQLFHDVLHTVRDKAGKLKIDGDDEGAGAGDKKKGGKKTAGEKKPKEKKGPGIIDSIEEFLKNAGCEEKALTKAQLTSKLANRFKDKNAEGMAKTVNVQVPNRLKNDRKVKIKSCKVKDKDDKETTAYWIES